MPLKPCIECGTPTPGPRCPTHQRTNNSNTRGYGAEHQAERRRVAVTLPTPCGYGCGTTLHPTDPWVLAHRVDGDPTYGWIPSCRSCNERAKQRRNT